MPDVAEAENPIERATPGDNGKPFTARNRVEPYMIPADRDRRGLASIRAESPAGAEGIPGIGPVKLHAVAPRFPEAVAKRERNGD